MAEHLALPEWLGRVHRAPQLAAELIRAGGCLAKTMACTALKDIHS